MDTGPDFSITISTSISQVTVPVEGSATVGITISRGGNYSGVVFFAVEGLPSYVTGTFEPPTLGGSATQTTLTLSAGDEASTGEYSVTITAWGDVVPEVRATLRCNVQLVPDFQLVMADDTLPIGAGTTALSVVTVVRKGGFTGGVNLSVAGAPQGVTATFNPNPAAAGATDLTIDVGAAVPAGKYQLTVKGTASGIARAQHAAHARRERYGGLLALDRSDDGDPTRAWHNHSDGHDSPLRRLHDSG